MKTKTKLFTLTLLTIFSEIAISVAQTPTYQWVNQGYPATSSNAPTVSNAGVAVDASGNTYVTGTFKLRTIFGVAPDTLSVDEQIASNSDYGDIYLAKYDNTGHIVWAQQGINKQHHFGLLTSNSTRSIAVNANNDIFITGVFYDTIAFGSTVLTSQGNSGVGAFVAKYNSAGNVLWAVKAGTGEIYPGGLALDAAGNCYLTGFGNGTISAPITIVNFSATTPGAFFVSKYNGANGNAIWGKGNNGTFCEGTSISASANHLFVTGYTQQGAVFGQDTVLNSFSNSNAIFFITKMDTSSNYLWAKGSSNYSMTSTSHGLSVVADNSGNCYVGGNYTGNFQLSSFNLPAGNGSQENAFLAKYDGTGNALWVNSLVDPNTNPNNIVAVCLDNANTIYATGYSTNNTNFGNYTLTYSGMTIAQYSATGTNLAADYLANFLENQNDYVTGLATDASGNLYVSGRFSYTETFGSLVLTNSSFYPGMYVGKLNLTTGIHSLTENEEQLSIYPNPSNGKFSIEEKSGQQEMNVEIYNALGEKMGQQKTTKEIDFSQLTPGIYLLRIYSGEKISSEKIIIQ